jgi:hypothetical protein
MIARHHDIVERSSRRPISLQHPLDEDCQTALFSLDSAGIVLINRNYNEMEVTDHANC